MKRIRSKQDAEPPISDFSSPSKPQDTTLSVSARDKKRKNVKQSGAVRKRKRIEALNKILEVHVQASPEVDSDIHVQASPEVDSDIHVQASPEVDSDIHVQASPEADSDIHESNECYELESKDKCSDIVTSEKEEAIYTAVALPMEPQRYNAYIQTVQVVSYNIIINMNLPLVTIVLTTVVVVVKNHECKDYDLSASDQSLIDMMKHYLHTSRKEESSYHASKPADTGVTYVHWGQVGGTDYTSKGGGVNYLCLPGDPENGLHQSYGNAQVYGSEYELGSSYKPSGWSESMNNKEVPCAVCYKKHRSTVLMIPGRKTCYKGWTSEYQGYLLSSNGSHSKKDFACVDRNAEPLDDKNGDENGALFYALRTKCGSLRCPPYSNEADLLCVVCTKINMFIQLVTTVLTTIVAVVNNHECKDENRSASDQSLVQVIISYPWLDILRFDITYELCSTEVHKKAGQVGGNDYTSKGGGVNYLCLPNDPESGQHQSYGNAQVYGWSESIENKEVPCSVCYRKHRSAVMMIPGRKTCYKEWTSEYHGYLLSSHATHYKKDFACVDRNAEQIEMYLPSVTIVLATVVIVVQNHECKDYVLSSSDQSLIDMMKHYLHTSRKEECSHYAGKPSDTGQVGGNYNGNRGGGVNYLCLQNDPENGQHQSHANDQVYGGEYQLSSSIKPSGWSESMADKEVPCAVCYQKRKSTVIMIPGRKVIGYKGWTSAYHGYLMSDHKSHYKKRLRMRRQECRTIGQSEWK
ncbi:unnamed protein product [Mytilus edulis]|uniref:Uncharacterized protein n=1 Tax=Mytilus edulis TaxID=6550 RepID=A0A8S3R7A4_MYTED|nr:unnamed protein product [Mytilus edulis]